MNRFIRTLLVVTVVLMVPVVPFLICGAALETRLEAFLAARQTATWTAATVFGLLSSDIFLPVPSSVLTTVAGGRLGISLGTLIAWAGMSTSALIGYFLARKWGRPLVTRWISVDQWQFEDRITDRHGVWLVVVTRAIPVVAEAMVLLAGMHAMPVKTFVPAVFLSNLGIALAYTALGSLAARQHWLPFALGVAAALPLLLPAVIPLFGRAKS